MQNFHRKAYYPGKMNANTTTGIRYLQLGVVTGYKYY